MAFFMKKSALTYLLLLISLATSAQWHDIPLPTKASFRAIKSYQRDIWISGTKGTYIHSQDEGNTWEVKQVPGAEGLDFRDLVILNKKEIILMSAGPSEKGAAKLFKTKDGGQTWDLLFDIKEPNYFFDAIAWDYKKRIGFLLSDPIDRKFVLFKILQNGSKIEPINLTHFPALLPREAAFAASGSSILWLNNTLHIISGGGNRARVFQSLNADLSTWEITHNEIAADTSSGFFTIAAKNNTHFWVAGGNYLKIDSSKIPIMESKDGGKSWSPIENPIPKNYYIEKVIWSNPYWITTGPAGSYAFHTLLKKWVNLDESHFHNIIATQQKIIGVGTKGQIGYLLKKDLDKLFLPKE
jgi:photosystem II stability/assembly factor-like uncharacterized protein